MKYTKIPRKNNKEKEYFSVLGWLNDKYNKPLEIEIVKELKADSNSCIVFESEVLSHVKHEEIPVTNMGTIIDLLTRFVLTGDGFNSFETIVYGYGKVDQYLHAINDERWMNEEWLTNNGIEYPKEYYLEIHREGKKYINKWFTMIEQKELTDKIIELTCKLINYNNFFRAGFKGFGTTNFPKNKTIKYIRVLVDRSVKFLKNFNGIKCGVYFGEKAFEKCKYIKAGDGDYWTDEILFDMKVKSQPTLYAKEIQQQIVYYLLSKRSGYNFKKIIVFTPKAGVYWEMDVDKIPQELINDIETNW